MVNTAGVIADTVVSSNILNTSYRKKALFQHFADGESVCTPLFQHYAYVKSTLFCAAPVLNIP